MAQQSHSKRLEYTCPHKNLYTDVSSHIVYKSQNIETTHMSINWWMDKQHVAFLHNGILLGHRKEWNNNICCNMDEPWRDYAKWKKLVIKTAYCTILFI